MNRNCALLLCFFFSIAVFDHAGDGNLHPSILFDRRDEDQRRRAEEAADEIFRIALIFRGPSPVNTASD